MCADHRTYISKLTPSLSSNEDMGYTERGQGHGTWIALAAGSPADRPSGMNNLGCQLCRKIRLKLLPLLVAS